MVALITYNIFFAFNKRFGLMLLCLFLFLTPNLKAQNDKKANIYVWNFKTNASDLKKFAEKFTDDFETELIKSHKYTVLQRRNHNLVMAHQDMENLISNVKNLSSEAVNQLKTIRAESVIFGELMEDIDSGIYEVTVLFQNLNNGMISKKESILIEKALLKSNAHRKQYMKNLMDKLHAHEILAAKNTQFEIISEKIDKYFIRVKDVQIAFKDIMEIALKHEAYFKELENTIQAYNEIFTDINDNRENNVLAFETVWGKDKGKDLEGIYKGVMVNIHKKHILKLNDVRKKILAYRNNQLSKKQRAAMKNEIERDMANALLGLTADIDNVEDDKERLFFNLKEEIREE